MTNFMVNAFILKNSMTVVTDKNTIKNTKDEDFEEVSLILNESEIEKLYERVQKSKIEQ